jgi:type IV pilus assembly protein PilA
VKQCPNCKNNLADFVAVCPFCGAGMPVAQAPQVGAPPPEWSGPPQNSGKAIASLICGLVFFFWPLSAVAAVILGHLALSDIKRSAGRLAGRGMAIGGLVTGYIGVSIIPFLIIAAIAIPNLLRSRMAANEASAVGSLRTYNTAMITYSIACPDIGYPISLESLGPGARGCSHLDLMDAQLASQAPVRSGYRFVYAPQHDGSEITTRYQIVATPVNPGITGVRQFFTDEAGVIRFSMNGSPNADSDPLQ